jgi:DNA-binding transcriptional MocR family regulator
MRAAYRERLDALSSAIQRLCGGALSLRPVGTGLHAVADMEHVDIDADRVAREASVRGVELMPLSAYCMARRQPANALVLGFAAVRADAIAVGVEKLADAIAAARRPPQRSRSEPRFQAHG